MDFRQAIMNRLAQSQGLNGLPVPGNAQPNIMDPRSLMGVLSRGQNVYRGGSNAAQTGGPNIGRPPGPPKTNAMNSAISRRLQGY